MSASAIFAGTSPRFSVELTNWGILAAYADAIFIAHSSECFLEPATLPFNALSGRRASAVWGSPRRNGTSAGLGVAFGRRACRSGVAR